jgi:hypothetical protein
MDENTFYDIHMHVFNLSHPNLSAFMKRFKINSFLQFGPLVGLVMLVVAIPPFKQLFGNWVENKLGKMKNLLAVMEDDTDGVFLLIENCLKENGLLDNAGLHINGKTYSRYVLTPLMMDFGVKGKMDKNIHYKEPCRKLIRRQVYDVFSAIKYYYKFDYKKDEKKNLKRYPYIKAGDKRIFEIYPFIGMNPKNYDSEEELLSILEKYFKDYKGKREDLKKNLGRFDGDVDNLTSNFAAGIKLYPPLDFDPWPDPLKKKTESDKVKRLYQYCLDKGIPITVHGSESGFVAVGKKKLQEYTQIAKWETVLANYKGLKINLAHFPVNEWNFRFFPKTERLNQVLDLLDKHESLWVDFSCRATTPKYYTELKKLHSKSAATRQKKLMERVMFGTDFSINLLDIQSYNAYVKIFADDIAFKGPEKERFCSLNPQSFLFQA